MQTGHTHIINTGDLATHLFSDQRGFFSRRDIGSSGTEHTNAPTSLHRRVSLLVDHQNTSRLAYAQDRGLKLLAQGHERPTAHATDDPPPRGLHDTLCHS